MDGLNPIYYIIMNYWFYCGNCGGLRAFPIINHIRFQVMDLHKLLFLHFYIVVMQNNAINQWFPY